MTDVRTLALWDVGRPPRASEYRTAQALTFTRSGPGVLQVGWTTHAWPPEVLKIDHTSLVETPYGVSVPRDQAAGPILPVRVFRRRFLREFAADFATLASHPWVAWGELRRVPDGWMLLIPYYVEYAPLEATA